MHLDPVHPLAPLAVALPGLLWAVWSARRLGGRPGLALGALRLLASLGLALTLARPHWIERAVDPARTVVAVLLDRSGSLRGESWEPGRALPYLDPAWPVAYWAFDTSARPWAERAPAASGETSLGQALADVLARSPEVAGILLVSDGLHNHGLSPAAGAALCAERGVPVSTVAIGPRDLTGDRALVFAEERWEVEEGGEVEIALRLAGPGPAGGEVQLWEEDRLLAVLEPPAPDAAGEARISFRHRPEGRGLRRLRAVWSGADANPGNNSAFASLEVKPPPRLRLLYLAGGPGPRLRFLDRAFQPRERFVLDALVPLDPSRTFSRGQVPPDWAAREDFFYAYDVVLLESGTDLPEAVRERLRGFVERKGGALVFLGEPPAESVWGGLLPLTGVHPRSPNVSWRSGEGAPAAPPDLAQTTLWTGHPRLGARLRLSAGADPVVVDQPYGAGRTAQWAVANDWVWALAGESGRRFHAEFWGWWVGELRLGNLPRLLAWPRDQALPAGRQTVAVEVLDPEYRLSGQARASLEITGPGGDSATLPLAPDPRQLGRFSADLELADPGLYRLRTEARLEDGESLEQTVFLAVTEPAAEGRERGRRPEVLGELARATGGWQAAAEDTPPGPLPLRADLPRVELRHYFLENAAGLLLLVLLWGADWLYRRSKGLA